MFTAVGDLWAHLSDLSARLTLGSVAHGHIFVPEHRKPLSLLPV